MSSRISWNTGGEKKKKKRKRSRKFACLDYRETWNNYESTKAISFFYPVSRRRCVHARISHGNIETLPSSDHAISPIKKRNTTSRRMRLGDFLSPWFSTPINGVNKFTPRISRRFVALLVNCASEEKLIKKGRGQKIKCPMKYRVVFDMKTLSVVHTGREFMSIRRKLSIASLRSLTSNDR